MKQKHNPRLLIAILLFTALIFQYSCSSGDSSGIYSFSYTECKHTLVQGSKTRCGYLIVPENRSDPKTRLIYLYAAIFPNPSAKDGLPYSEPLVYLTGGPGAATLGAGVYDIFENRNADSYIYDAFRDNRDVIVLDQRGTNSSLPALYCSQEVGTLRASVYGLRYPEAADIRLQHIQKCYDRLKADGIDLSGYDTLENAADVRDLRNALGYAKISIYSASYGTRLAMKVMQYYPDIINSVILDSILPPEVNPYEKESEALVYAFDHLFKVSRQAYPNAEKYYYEMVDRLEQNPVFVTGHHYDSNGKAVDNIKVQVTGVHMVFYLFQQLKNTPYDQNLPKKIYNMYQSGNYQDVADQWISNIDFFFPNGEAASSGPSLGMYNSVFSAEDAYFTSPDRIRQVIRQNTQNPTIITFLETHFIRMEPAVLGIWPVQPVSADYQRPLVSSIPTLMFAGALDTATPVIFSKPSAAHLSRSFYYEIVSGHATAYLPCVNVMLNNFLKNPLNDPGNLCPTGYSWN